VRFVGRFAVTSQSYPHICFRHRRLPGDGVLGLGDLLVDAAQGAPGPVMAVLLVDHLVAVCAGRVGGPRLSEDTSVGDLLAGVLALPGPDCIIDRLLSLHIYASQPYAEMRFCRWPILADRDG
jgi:hypothetical protein